jgi:hypothetical protein
MRKFFLTLAGAALLAGSMSVVSSEPAMARDHHHARHHKVCRTVWKKKVVWRHHRPHTIRYKTRHCWYR